MVTNRIFRCFCISRFGIGPFHKLSSRFDLSFDFAEIFVLIIPRVGYWIFKKKTTRIGESKQLPSWVSRWVTESPCWWVGESLSDKKDSLALYVCLLLQASLVLAVAGLSAVVGIPTFDLSMLLPTPLPCWYFCGCFYCTVACIPAVTGNLLLLVSCFCWYHFCSKCPSCCWHSCCGSVLAVAVKGFPVVAMGILNIWLQGKLKNYLILDLGYVVR